jgi:predicted lipase
MSWYYSVSALVYIIVELRRQAKLRLMELQHAGHLELDERDIDDLEVAWAAHKKLSDQISKGDGKHVKLEDLGALVEQLRLENKNRENLGKGKGLTEADMALADRQFEILHLPKSSTEILTDLSVNADYVGLKVFMAGFGGDKINLDALKSIIERDGSTPSEISYIDDEFSSEGKIGLKSELTYGITVHHKLQRVAVVFRGSTALNDWLINVKVDDTDFDLPGPHAKTRTNYGRVHEGFYKYLFDDTKPGRDGRTISKAEEIMSKLRELFNTYPDYKLWVTGHSLGGALSTMFAFRAATDSGVRNKPVMNVSFASPFVGDHVFRDKFQDLEKTGMIRHLRITNEDDVVPLVPFSTLDFPPKLYKHVGMNVRLYNTTPWRRFHYKISYPKVGGSVFDELGRAISNNMFLGLTYKVLDNHLCPEYRKRLDNAAVDGDLKQFYLEALYHDPYYVGKLHEA